MSFPPLSSAGSASEGGSWRRSAADEHVYQRYGAGSFRGSGGTSGTVGGVATLCAPAHPYGARPCLLTLGSAEPQLQAPADFSPVRTPKPAFLAQAEGGIRCGNALCDRQNTELSESLIETKVDILEDLATATEQEAVADDSDTSCAHPLSRPRSATRLLLERRRTVKKRALRSGWRITRDCSR